MCNTIHFKSIKADLFGHNNKNLSGYFNLIKNKRIILYLKLRYKSVFLLMKIFLNDIS